MGHWLLIDTGSVQLSAQDREVFNQVLRQEQQKQVYKGDPVKAVTLFQKQYQLELAV